MIAVLVHDDVSRKLVKREVVPAHVVAIGSPVKLYHEGGYFSCCQVWFHGNFFFFVHDDEHLAELRAAIDPKS